MDFYLTLQEIMKQKNMTIPEVARACNLTDSTVRSIIDRKQKKIALNVAFKISSGLGVTLERLNGENEIVNSGDHKYDLNFSESEKEHIKKYRALDKHGKDAVDSILNIEHNRCTEVSTLPLAEVIQMPIPIQSASAGTGELADDDTIEHIPVLRNVWTSKADYALRVHGDSMEPDIYDGDMILVRSQPAVELGETGIFIRDGERYVKIYRGDYLESLNPDYDDIPLEEFSKCIGKVIGVLKPEWIAK